MAGALTNFLYKHVPIPLQNLGVSLYGYKWKKRRFGGVFEQEYKAVKAREAFSVQQWRDYQTTELRKLLVHAFTTVPFYRDKYSALGFTESMLARFELSDLKKLPILTKNEVRRFCDTTLLSAQPKPGGEFFSSSGSTGTPTKIYYTEEMHQRWSASFEARIRNWAGVDRFTPRGMIGGRRVVPDGNAKPPYYRYNIFEKQTYFSAYHIGPSTVSDYLKGMRTHNVQYMNGYAMSNYLLAEFLDELNLEAPQLKAVITSSEKLTPQMRAKMEKVYRCKSYDSYGAVEACCSITQNEYGQLLDNPDVAILEYLDEQGNDVMDGEVGEIYCTGLLNFDQPLIRYQVGDKARIAANQQTTCGRHFRVIDEIMGRTEDTITGPDGRKMVRFHGIFIDIPAIIQGQIIQHTLHNFTVRVAVSTRLSQHEKDTISNKMKSQLGDINLHIDEVAQIPPSPNGKYKAVISELPKS